MGDISALDRIVDDRSRNFITEHFGEIVKQAIQKEGFATLAMSRDLAILHESGHVIVGALDGAIIERVEISNTRAPKPLRPFIGEKTWGGVTTYESDPYRFCERKTTFDVCKLDLPAFRFFVRREISGLASEHTFFKGDVPLASSADEVALSQALCMMRVIDKFLAQNLWREIFESCCRDLQRNRVAVICLATALEKRPTIGGKEVHKLIDPYLVKNDPENAVA